MADDSDTGSSQDAGRARRPPPTIELKAAEVVDRPVVSEAAASDAPAEPPDTAPSDMPPPDMSEPEIADPAPSRRAPILIPAAVGAIVAAAVIGAAWFAGVGNAPSTDPAAFDGLAARVTRIEARPAAVADTGLATRIDALEKSVTALRGDIAASKAQADRANAAIAELKSAPGQPAAAVDLSPLTQRLGQIERTTTELKTAAAQQTAKPVDDAALRRVVAASLLDTSVRQGEPYAAALAAVKPLANNADQLKPLDAFATTGVPNAAALSRELLTLLPKLAPLSTETSAAGAGFVDRLQASAAKLIHLERTDAAGAGSNAGAVSRATAAARSNDVVTARRELLTLPSADRAAVQPWLDKVDSRDAALAASRQFAADAMAALSKPAP